MPSVCFYFEVHQPYRLKPYGALQVGRDHDYFDEKLNAEVLRKVATKCTTTRQWSASSSEPKAVFAFLTR